MHRDIKPENLLLDREGRVKVADVGIARILNMAEPKSAKESEEVEVNLTGEVALGTPNYMAPEQADAPAAVDHRADIYSLGVVFYEMLTGERPSPAVFQPPSSRVGVDVRADDFKKLFPRETDPKWLPIIKSEIRVLPDMSRRARRQRRSRDYGLGIRYSFVRTNLRQVLNAPPLSDSVRRLIIYESFDPEEPNEPSSTFHILDTLRQEVLNAAAFPEAERNE
ncbi:MAG: protein kinase domain-containing protein [Verrucomicrobiales bacterium]